MVDFVVDMFAEIADFFITFLVDDLIDKFAKRDCHSRMPGSETGVYQHEG